MTESLYNQRIEETFEQLELILDELDDDVDYENTGGVLTVEFENGTSLVFSRQLANQQLWLAARSGGFHFEYDESAQDWRGTRDAQYLRPFVVALMLAQGDVVFEWQ